MNLVPLLLHLAAASAAHPAVGVKALVAPSVDPAAISVLNRVQARMKAIRTLSGTCTFTLTSNTKQGAPHAPRVMVEAMQVRFSRPNLARMVASLAYHDPAASSPWERSPKFETIASDGKTYWREYHFSHEFETWRVDPNGHDIRMFSTMPLDGFFDPQAFVTARLPMLRGEGILRSLTLRGRQLWHRVFYRVVRLVYREVGKQFVLTERYFVGADLLIHHIDVAWSTGERYADYDLTGIKVNAPMSKASFAYQPSADAHPMTYDTTPTKPVANGTPVADFTVEGRNGEPLRLSGYRGKVVLIDFWATWCGNCIQAFPQVNAIAHKYPDVVVLAIDVGDNRALFIKWLRENRGNKFLVFALDPAGIEGRGIDSVQFKLSGLPATYVIGRDGKIAASFAGYDGNEVELEKAVKAAVGPHQKT